MKYEATANTRVDYLTEKSYNMKSRFPLAKKLVPLKEPTKTDFHASEVLEDLVSWYVNSLKTNTTIYVEIFLFSRVKGACNVTKNNFTVVIDVVHTLYSKRFPRFVVLYTQPIVNSISRNNSNRDMSVITLFLSLNRVSKS